VCSEVVVVAVVVVFTVLFVCCCMLLCCVGCVLLVDEDLIFPRDSGHGVKLLVQITSVSDIR